MDWPRLLNRVVSLASLALVYYLGETGQSCPSINVVKVGLNRHSVPLA